MVNGHVCSLEPFRPGTARAIASWARTERELDDWASLAESPTPRDFERWHGVPDVHAFILEEAERVIGYGEIWIERAEREVELARIIVAPERRGRGFGAILVQRLIERAAAHPVDTAWVRVVPGNGPATACYARSGFEPASRELQQELNAPQPRDYLWMQRAL